MTEIEWEIIPDITGRYLPPEVWELVRQAQAEIREEFRLELGGTGNGETKL